MTKIIPGEKIAEETVKSSSSDNVYTVTLYDNCISCTCPAGGRKTLCKHMVGIIHHNLEVLKNKNSAFHKDICYLLEMKNDKNHDVATFKNLSSMLIFSDKNIAQQSFFNSTPFVNEKIKKNDSVKNIKNDIDNINIHQQFEFFKLLCIAYNKRDIGFRYCEYPTMLDEFIKRNHLVSVETSNKDFRKMDAGRKSIYFYKLSPEVSELTRQLHKELSEKFPKVQVPLDEDGLLFTEERIIDPKYL